MNDLPPPLCDYTFIPCLEAYKESLRHPFPAYVRFNNLKRGEREIIKTLEQEGYSVSAVDGLPFFYEIYGPGNIGNSISFLLGYIYPQAISSALPVLALNVKGGELILDMCAAPGGKTTFLAQLMNNTGIIVANDRKLGRLTALTANIKRMGVTNCVVTFHRGENFPYINLGPAWSNPPPTESGPFHAVILDAPCSGEGKYKLDQEGRLLYKVPGHTNLPAIQKGLILRAFDLLRPGGRLVYSTCTINPLENEGVVDYLLKKREAEVISWEPPLPSREGVTQFCGHTYDEQTSRCRRFYPHEIRSVGFFVAVVRKPR